MYTSEYLITTPQRCSKCKQEFPRTTEFFSPSGKLYACGFPKLSGICKKCNAQQTRDRYKNNQDYRWYAKRHSREQIENGYFRNYYRNSVVKDRYRERSRKRLEKLKSENPNYQRDKSRRRRSRNPEKFNEYARKQRLKNPAKTKRMEAVKSAKRRALEKSATGSFTSSDLKMKYEIQNGKCFWCGAELGDGYHADHVVPLSRGGSNSSDNIVISCSNCNQRKHNKMPEDWIMEISENGKLKK